MDSPLDLFVSLVFPRFPVLISFIIYFSIYIPISSVVFYTDDRSQMIYTLMIGSETFVGLCKLKHGSVIAWNVFMKYVSLKCRCNCQ